MYGIGNQTALLPGKLTSVNIYREKDSIIGVLLPGKNDKKNKPSQCALEKTKKGFGFGQTNEKIPVLSAGEFNEAHRATFSDKNYCDDPTNFFELKLAWSVNYEDPNYPIALKENPKYEIEKFRQITMPVFKGIYLYQYMIFMVYAAQDYYNFYDCQIDQEQFYILTKAGYVKNQLESIGFTAYIKKGEIYVKAL